MGPNGPPKPPWKYTLFFALICIKKEQQCSDKPRMWGMGWGFGCQNPSALSEQTLLSLGDKQAVKNISVNLPIDLLITLLCIPNFFTYLSLNIRLLLQSTCFQSPVRPLFEATKKVTMLCRRCNGNSFLSFFLRRSLLIFYIGLFLFYNRFTLFFNYLKWVLSFSYTNSIFVYLSSQSDLILVFL